MNQFLPFPKLFDTDKDLTNIFLEQRVTCSYLLLFFCWVAFSAVKEIRNCQLNDIEEIIEQNITETIPSRPLPGWQYDNNRAMK